MTDTTFSDQTTVIEAAWLNAVNDLVYDALNGATTSSEVVDALGGVIKDLDTLGAPSTDGEFIVATGAGAFAYESGTTVRTSLGLGTGDDVEFSGLTGTAQLIFSGLISPAQLTADQNNYAPTGIDTCSVIRVDSDASRTITGLSASQVEGREITIENDGTNAIVLSDEDANSTAANRFALPDGAAVTIGSESSVTLKYDGTASRWRVKGAAGGGSGGATTGSNTIGFVNDSSTDGSYTLGATERMVTTGSFTITSGDTITITSGGRWRIV